MSRRPHSPTAADPPPERPRRLSFSRSRSRRYGRCDWFALTLGSVALVSAARCASATAVSSAARAARASACARRSAASAESPSGSSSSSGLASSSSSSGCSSSSSSTGGEPMPMGTGSPWRAGRHAVPSAPSTGLTYAHTTSPSGATSKKVPCWPWSTSVLPFGRRCGQHGQQTLGVAQA